ncbi:MAG: MarR family transcriptional regulator [bacterium]|nr:MarR family transcriptional regulator [bacterium]
MEEIRMNCLLKQIKAALEQYERSNPQEMDMTIGQCIMLNYLLNQDSRDLYATDIHVIFGISKATVSTILKSLKKKGYLLMEEDMQDDRRKRLVLTEKAYEMQQNVEEALRKRGEDMCRGISRQELEMTEQVLCRMLLNLRNKNSENKEEPI